jgi:hypothetical protein
MTTTDLSEFAPTGKPCKVQRALDSMPPERSSVVAQALAGDESTYTTNKIRSVIARADHIYISGDTWLKHRRSECSCEQ